DAAGAIHDERSDGIERGQVGVGKCLQRNVKRWGEGAEGAFPIVADVEELGRGGGGGERGAEFLHRDFVRERDGFRRGRGANLAVAVRWKSGDGACAGIDGEAKGAGAHGERVEEKETTGERFADAGEELDR